MGYSVQLRWRGHERHVVRKTPLGGRWRKGAERLLVKEVPWEGGVQDRKAPGWKVESPAGTLLGVTAAATPGGRQRVGAPSRETVRRGPRHQQGKKTRALSPQPSPRDPRKPAGRRRSPERANPAPSRLRASGRVRQSRVPERTGGSV